uniref:OBG-type G domain-containing protein n=1 Tax=Strigamia maritima TaxID=126957 RepID=T1J6A8_STRMM
MVLKTLLLSTASKISRYRKSNFIDKLRIHVKGGIGGKGLTRFGGVGGKGGDVFVIAKDEYTLKLVSSKSPTKRFVAGPGNDSSTKSVLGPPGHDIRIKVPVGVTIVLDNGRVIGDLDSHDSCVLVARGGAGASPENNFTPQQAESHSISLDLKLIADVGFVGFPNAGKSTLLQAISKAKPKVASYPFTTIQPSVGIVQFPDHLQIALADLPGLIEGAHYNVGMGHRFLKHVERTKLLLFVVDVNGFQLGVKYPFRSAFETIVLLNKELELYKEELLDKRAVLVINKMDTETADTNFDLLMNSLNNVEGKQFKTKKL